MGRRTHDVTHHRLYLDSDDSNHLMLTVERRCCHRHWRSEEHLPGAYLPGLAREAEHHHIGSCRSPGESPVALHLLLEPTSDLASEIELEEKLDSATRTLEPSEAIRPNVSLRPVHSPRLATPSSNLHRTLHRSRDVEHPSEEAVRGSGMSQPRAVH